MFGDKVIFIGPDEIDDGPILLSTFTGAPLLSVTISPSCETSDPIPDVGELIFASPICGRTLPDDISSPKNPLFLLTGVAYGISPSPYSGGDTSSSNIFATT
jgi:hypothetical protein